MMGPSYPVLNVCELKLKKEKYKNRRQIVTGTVLSSHQPAMPPPLLLLKRWCLDVFHISLYFFLIKKSYCNVNVLFVSVARDRIPPAEVLLGSR